MAFGIKIVPEDFGKEIELTTNVRIPQFCGRLRMVPGVRYNIPGYVPGSQIYTIVDSFGGMNINMGMQGKPPNGWTYQPLAIQRVNVSGGQIWCDYAPNSLPMNIFTYEGVEYGGVLVWVFQVLPVGSGNYGLKLVNSTNLMEVSNVGMTLRPIWRGVVNFTGAWEFPQIAGYDRYKYIPFVHWSNTNCGLTRNTALGYLNVAPSFPALVSCQPDLSGKYEGIGHPIASGSAEVVLFYPVAPETTHSGINIFNSARQCTWSTKHTPFLLRGQISLSKGWSQPIPGVQRAMIPVTMGGFQYTGPNGFYRHYGIRSNGNQFIVTSIGSGYTTKGSPGFETVNNAPIPVIDAADYF